MTSIAWCSSGRLTRDPGAPAPSVRDACPPDGHRGQRAPEGRHGQVGRQAELLRREAVRATRPSLAPVPRQGRAVGIDGRLDWSSWEAQDGSKRSKVEVVADRHPVPRQPRRGRVPEYRRTAAETSSRWRRRRQPDTTTSPTTGADDDIPSRRTDTGQGSRQADRAQAQGRSLRRAGPAEELLLLPREDRRRSTTRTTTSCGGSRPRRARSARAGSPAPAAATRTRSPSRSSGRARWRCCRTSG